VQEEYSDDNHNNGSTLDLVGLAMDQGGYSGEDPERIEMLVYM
jgi:hypothetical protein